MDKPISMVLNELKTNIANIVNDAKLPPCLVEPILKDLYLEAQSASQLQLQKDIAEYQKQNETTNE